MLFLIAVNASWIALTIGLYGLVAALCQELPSHSAPPHWLTKMRVALSRRSAYVWYATLFLASIIALSVGIVSAVHTIKESGVWQTVGTVATVTAVLYSVRRLWPGAHNRDWHVRRDVTAIIVGILTAGALVAFPGWVTENLAGLVLCVPPMIWFRGMHIGTATSLLLALAVHDAIHDLGTDYMGRFMKLFAYTPFIIYLPKTAELSPLSSIGLGDLLIPGIMVVQVARVAKIREQPQLVRFTCAGAALGFASALTYTLTTDSHFPMLVTLVPGVLGGYWAAVRLHRTTDVAAVPVASAGGS